jgi:hypothetical protein
MIGLLRRRVGVFVWLVLLAAGVVGCGSGGGAGSSAAGVVASVAGVSISKASLEHWIRVESAVSYKTIPINPLPRGILPDPPSYAACIAWLGSAAGSIESRSKSPAQRKALCVKRLVGLKQKTLGFLLSYQWYAGELKDEGVKVPESVVHRNLVLFVRGEMPAKGEFQRYLRVTGMSEADVLFIQRLGTYGDEIAKQIYAKGSEAEAHRALARFTSKWVAKTSCNPGYIVPGCRQYHGPEPPP